MCGSRDMHSERWLRFALNMTLFRFGPPRLIAHGAGQGADSLADRWAKWRRIEVRTFPAEWGRYGPSAGPIRNGAMLREIQPELVVAFWDGRISRSGTLDMMRQAIMEGVQVHVLPAEGTPWTD